MATGTLLGRKVRVAAVGLADVAPGVATVVLASVVSLVDTDGGAEATAVPVGLVLAEGTAVVSAAESDVVGEELAKVPPRVRALLHARARVLVPRATVRAETLAAGVPVVVVGARALVGAATKDEVELEGKELEDDALVVGSGDGALGSGRVGGEGLSVGGRGLGEGSVTVLTVGLVGDVEDDGSVVAVGEGKDLGVVLGGTTNVLGVLVVDGVDYISGLEAVNVDGGAVGDVVEGDTVGRLVTSSKLVSLGVDGSSLGKDWEESEEVGGLHCA